MAQLIYPVWTGEYGKNFRKIPYIMSADGDYLAGLNFYLHDRLSGFLDHNGDVRTMFKPPSDDLIRSVSYSLLDAVNWLEWLSGYLDSPIRHWTEARPWHFTYLYSTSMLKGYWSQEFWASGNPTPLSPSRTIVPRVNEICACYKFMAREGLIAPWSDGLDGIEKWGKAWAILEATYLNSLPRELRVPKARRYNKRKSPGKRSPPLPMHLEKFFLCFNNEGCFRAARLIFTTGLRIEEAITQTLVPGTIHKRNPEKDEKFYPQSPYVLRHDPSDDAMIGVMPSLEVALGGDDTVCEYRVMGKGRKIRSIPVPHVEMRAIWRYRDRVCEIHESGPSSFFLNSNLTPITAATLSGAILSASRMASLMLGLDLNLTAHALRHAFACRFMEAAILGQAEQAGIGFSELTPDQIDKFGRGPIMTLQDILGHEWLETTELYLDQLKGGIMAFIYTRMFNKTLDNVEWDSEFSE